jgi:hypothetical protein
VATADLLGRDPGDDDLEDVLREKFRVCIRTGLAPSEYDAMTDLEVDLWREVWNAENSE